MCGRSNEAVLRVGFSFFSSFSADILHIPSVIFFAYAAAQPGRLSMEGCSHHALQGQPDNPPAQATKKFVPRVRADFAKPSELMSQSPTDSFRFMSNKSFDDFTTRIGKGLISGFDKFTSCFWHGVSLLFCKSRQATPKYNNKHTKWAIELAWAPLCPLESGTTIEQVVTVLRQFHITQNCILAMKPNA